MCSSALHLQQDSEAAGKVLKSQADRLISGIFLSGGGAGGALPPPLNFDNPKRSRIWEAYVVVRLAAT